MITLAMASCWLSSGCRLFLLAERFLSEDSGKTSRCLWPLVSTGGWKTESGSMTAVSRSAGRGPLRDWYRGSLAPAKFIFFRRSTEMTVDKNTESSFNKSSGDHRHLLKKLGYIKDCFKSYNGDKHFKKQWDFLFEHISLIKCWILN